MAVSGFPSSSSLERKRKGSSQRGSRSLRVFVRCPCLFLSPISLSLFVRRSKRMATRVDRLCRLEEILGERERDWMARSTRLLSRKKVSKRGALVSARPREVEYANEGCRRRCIDMQVRRHRRGGCECSLHFARE